MGGIRFTLPARQGQPARPVRQHLWAQRVRLRDGQGAALEATCIVAREVALCVLKNGCGVEALQLSTMQRLERALAFFMEVA